MESMELINSGLDAVNAIIAYLAKDAVGSDFLNKYSASRDVQKATAQRQEKALTNLIESSSAMDENTKDIVNSASENLEGMNNIYKTIAGLRDSTANLEAEYKKYTSQFQTLIEQTRTITSFIGEIEKISSQTNLLSFNASIEAAHAGKAGAGFRIIANEVKKLSENTQKSTTKIMHNVSELENSIKNLEAETRKNTDGLKTLTEEANKTLADYEAVQAVTIQSQRSVENFSSNISDNVSKINSIIETVHEAESLNAETVNLFTDCASRNQMLFNDLYSFIYEIKAVFEDLKKQQ